MKRYAPIDLDETPGQYMLRPWGILDTLLDEVAWCFKQESRDYIMRCIESHHLSRDSLMWKAREQKPAMNKFSFLSSST